MNLLPASSSQRFTEDESGAYLHHVGWTPPPENSWKLNVSGFVSERLPGAGGAAFVIRDHNAVFKYASAIPVRDVGGVLLPELVALAQGLDTAIYLGIDSLEVEGACDALFDLLADGAPPVSGFCRELLGRSVELMRSFKTLTLHRVNVYKNAAASKLAVLAVWEEKSHSWPIVPPNAITGIMLNDVIGLYVPIVKP